MAGIDEVGVGCLAGPVMAAAVVLRSDHKWLGELDDSKRLGWRKREELHGKIMDEAVAVGMGYASNTEIDKDGISAARGHAMVRAYQEVERELGPAAVAAVVDGAALRGLRITFSELKSEVALCEPDHRQDVMILHQIGIASGVVPRLCLLNKPMPIRSIGLEHEPATWDPGVGDVVAESDLAFEGEAGFREQLIQGDFELRGCLTIVETLQADGNALLVSDTKLAALVRPAQLRTVLNRKDSARGRQTHFSLCGRCVAAACASSTDFLDGLQGVLEHPATEPLTQIRATETAEAMPRTTRLEGQPLLGPLHLGACFSGVPSTSKYHQGYYTIAVDKADQRSLNVAAASIVAKVTRDRYMRLESKVWSSWGFDRNVGYGTPEHLEALKRHGTCPLHRKTFAPVREAIDARR